MSTPITPKPCVYQDIAVVPGGVPAFRVQGSLAGAQPPIASINSLHLDPRDWQHGKSYITSADLLAANSVPIPIISAPPTINTLSTPQGALNPAFLSLGSPITPTLFVWAIYLRFLFNSVQYANGGALSFVYHGTAVTTMNTVAAAIITGGVNKNIWVNQLSGATGVDVTTGAGLGIDMKAAGADFITGNSTIVLDVYYNYL